MEIEKSSTVTKDNFPAADFATARQSKSAETKVEVAVRVRPFISKEILNRDEKCVQTFRETNQILMGKDRTFNFDKVFDENSRQDQVYEECAKDLVLSCLAGYNTTILAYGQTGSGKTHTMGSSATYHLNHGDTGIIPRVMKEIFLEIEKRAQKSEFIVRVSFLEIYNEEIQDLLDNTNSRLKINSNLINKNPISIREEKDGSISVYGIVEEKVSSYEEMAACLERGSLNRATASTLMNETSSRSHAIFTISIEQHQIEDLYKDESAEKKNSKQPDDGGFTTAKFHFVDLAGSERVKRTGASGSILREGININRGLLALGNVISALTDDTGKVSHVPYRESKLTRMLQDSLGGNSRTVMIACISPAESNFDESLNTLKYASRARNIRNKPIINRDPQSTLISQLKQQVFELQNELLACRRMFGANLKENNMSDHMYGSASKIFAGNLASSREENALKDEVKTLKLKLFQSEKEMVKVSNELKEVKNALNKSEISLYSIQKERDLLKVIQEKYKKFIEDNGMHFNLLDDSQLIEVEGKDIMEEYTQKIENLKQELKDKERANIDLQQDYEILIKSSAKDQKLLLEKTKTIQFLTSQLKKEKALVKRLQQQGNEVEANKSPNGMGVEQSNEGDLKIEEVMESEEEGNEEDEMLDREYEVNTQATREEMMLVDGTLTEKEELLENITQNQMLLEKNLAEEMKNQYYSKILELEDEIKLLERKRDDTISKMNVGQQHNDNEKNKVITTYKHKISELETSLKDYKKKEREQQSLLKLVNNQRAKIDQLDGEINKIKTQKNLLQKRMREEAERFEKLKNTRQRELMEVKKKNIEKDAMITKLRSENKRKDLMYKKKAEELLARCMSKELMRHIGRGGNNGVNNHNLSTPRMSSSKKKTNAANRGLMSNATNSAVQENNKLEVEETGGLEVVQEHDVRQLVDFCTEQLLEHLKLSYEIEKEGENLRKTEEELEIERNKYSHILLTRDKLEIEKREAANDLELEQSLATKIQEYELELNEIFTRVENLEEKVEFQTGKLKSLTDQLSAKPLVNVEELLINNNRISHNPLNYQMILRCLFGKHIGSNLEIVKLQEKLNNFVNTVAELNKKIDDIQQRARFSELQYEINLTKLTKEYEKNQLLLIKQQDYTEDDEEGSDPDKEVTMGTETVDKNALNFNLLQKSVSDVANSNRQYLAGRGQSVLQQTRHRRAHSGADGSHSRGNSVKMVESPTRKSVKDGDLGKKGEKNEQVKKLEKTISEMNKKQQSSDKVIETLKRKCEVLQAKYDQFKKQTAKEKFIGLQKDDPLLGSLNTTTSNFSLLNENLNGDMIKGSPFATVSTANENININGQSFKNPLDVINSLNLLNFKDKRKEEKQRNRYGRQNQQNDSMQPPTIDTSLGDVSMKKKVPGFTVSTNANASNHRNLAINANISQVLRNSSTLPSMKKAYSPFQDIEEKMYLEPNPKEYGSARNIYEPGEGDFMVEDFLVSEKENISDKAFDDALAKSMDYNNKNWRCCLGIDTGHSGGVYSMVSHGNMLYTAGNKTIKLWSLDRMSYITELNAHTSSIKSMAVWADRNLLVSACDKAISLWDLTTLQSIATLKGHKDEIKALHIANNLLISAGKGSLSHGAILTWDLRSLGPTDEKEKNQEVFCMASNNGVLYYGSRNHQVRRVNLLTMESLPPFEPPHYDAVTSLTIVKDNLVSGSRDKNLRLWGLDQTQQNLRHTSYAHQDWINVIESNNARNLVYSGSRDGTIKIWNIINNKKLRCLSDINGHSQSVTSICQVYDENEAMFVTASLDKTIKIWKPMPEDTLAETNAQNTVKANHTSPGFKQYKTNQQGFDISPTNNDNSSPPSSIDKDKDLMI